MNMERTGGSVIRPPESAGWQSAERFFLDTARLAGYEEVRFPAGEKPDFAGFEPAKYSYVLPSKGMGRLRRRSWRPWREIFWAFWACRRFPL